MKLSSAALLVQITVGFLMGQRTPVAIVDFEGNGISEAETRALSDRMRNEIFYLDIYEVVERAMMEDVLQEQDFQLSGCTSNECLVEVGRLLGASRIIGGSISKVGSVFTISARMIDIETGKVVGAYDLDIQGSLEDVLMEGMGKMAAEIARSGRSASRQVATDSVVPQAEPRSSAAWGLFSRYEEKVLAKPTKPYSIGFLPFASYNDDQGLAYGFILQWDDKREGQFTPYYLSHRITIKRTTRGIGDYNYRLDSKYILPADLRLTFEVRSYVSLFEPYHGPGGVQTTYNEAFIDSTSGRYRGRFYYMYTKRSLEVSTLVQGRLRGEKFRWLAGLVMISTNVDSIDYDADDPGRQTLLAQHWEYYGADVEGGRENGLVGGLVWDSRDHEASPRRGLWTELLARWVPGSLDNDYQYTAVTATHRQYIPLAEDLTMAIRLSGRWMSSGAPFFTVPRIDGSFASVSGLGGNMTIRGVLWQRAVGRQLFYSNWELRYRARRLFSTGYLATSAFYDLGRTFDPPVTRNLADVGNDSDSWHAGLGAGLRIAVSDTFILALDLGWPRDPDRDGPGVKVYMGLDWLF